MPMHYERLKARHRAERQTHPTNLSLRVHRALSWLKRAEELAEDRDTNVILLWIAFNAAYATEIDERYRLSEQAAFRSFVEKLVALDTPRRLESLVWTEFSSSIRLLIDNQYVFQEFWVFHAGKCSEEAWTSSFARAKQAALKALAARETAAVLGVVLSRIYTLRNQLVHGGATWNGAVNRDQVRDCSNLMGKLVPVVIETMLDNPNTLWGDAVYPVVV